jgi:hypothetical protein
LVADANTRFVQIAITGLMPPSMIGMGVISAPAPNLACISDPERGPANLPAT